MRNNILAFPAVETETHISAIMVSYMTGPALFEAILAVMAETDIGELILVDNGNDIETRRKLREMKALYKRLHLVQGHGNIGFSRANNLGVSRASGKYLLFINPDAVLRKGAAKQLVDCGMTLKKPWVAGAMLRLTNGAEQRGARRNKLTAGSAFVSFTPLHKSPFFESLHLENKPVPQQPVAMPVVSGACMMMCRESYNELDGFDEDFFLHVEDIDICRRAIDAGGEVYFVPGATAVHYGSTSKARRCSVEWAKTKGFITYFRKHARSKYSRFLVTVCSPFIIIMIMGRSWMTAFQNFMLGR